MNISNEFNQECPFKSSEKVLIGEMRKSVSRENTGSRIGGDKDY
jgi:hypothetical protein